MKTAKLSDEVKRLKKGAMLIALRNLGIVSAACTEAEIARVTHYRWIDADGEYAKGVEEAKAVFIESLEREVDRRAKEGIRRYKFHRGEPVLIRCGPNDEGAFQSGTDDGGNPIWMRHYFEIEYSDILLMFRLKKLDQSYRENAPPPAEETALEDQQGTGIFDVIRKRLAGE